MEWIIGIKFRLYGDKIITSERAIIIMNHRTRLDWLYFYGVLMRHGRSLRDEKIVLKNDLKRVSVFIVDHCGRGSSFGFCLRSEQIPGPGWAMQCGSYIFLERKLDNDKCHLSNMVEYFAAMGHNTKVFRRCRQRRCVYWYH